MKEKKDAVKRKIEAYLKKGQIAKSEENKKLEKSFLAKARKNFTVGSLLFRISEQEGVKKIINLAMDFEAYDWVIVICYYAMYTSALAALARLGFRSKSHAATIAVLEYYYVNESKSLETKDPHKLVKAHALGEQLITKLIQTKTKRETAQYDATPAITKEMAKTSLEDADEFITKIDEVLQE